MSAQRRTAMPCARASGSRSTKPDVLADRSAGRVTTSAMLGPAVEQSAERGDRLVHGADEDHAAAGHRAAPSSGATSVALPACLSGGTPMTASMSRVNAY